MCLVCFIGSSLEVEMSVENLRPDSYFPYKKEPDGTVLFLELIEMVSGIAPDGENVTLFLRGKSLQPARDGTYQCVMPPDTARELAEILAGVVARLDDTAS